MGKLYEQKGPTKHQLYLGGYAVFTVDITDPSATGLTYLHGDRLGSVVEMSNACGQLISDGARGFDPFGKPREGDWSNSNHNDAAGGSVLLPNDLNRPDLTTRGFTGHEQLNNVALTHMNGRAYDYNLGRFLSVDPVIQFPANSQSLNPYSYILNNPLAGTDPTGYVASICGLGKISRCEGGGVAYLKAKQNEDKAFKLDVSFNNGGQASITFRMNQDGGLEFFNPELAEIGAVSLRNAIACNTACTAVPLVTTTTVLGVLAAAGTAALADSPLPGPGDIIGIGILVVGLYGIVNSSNDELPPNMVETGLNSENLKELAGTGSPNGFEPDPDDEKDRVKVEIDIGKFNYFFGRSQSNAHNIARSKQLFNELNRLGIKDNAVGKEILTEHLNAAVNQEGNIIRAFSNEYGNFEVRESLLFGPSGRVTRLESTFEILSDGTRRFITTIPKR